jgi:hypothetical protein
LFIREALIRRRRYAATNTGGEPLVRPAREAGLCLERLFARKALSACPRAQRRSREPREEKQMEAYRLYYVMSAKFKYGKGEEATRWWREKGAPDLLSDPWTKSLKAYAAQFSLAGKHDFEVWQEIEDYAALDRMDEWWAEDPVRAKKKEDLWKESAEYFEWGPSRLMGDFPESALLPE